MEQVRAIGNIFPIPQRSKRLLGYIEVFSRHGRLSQRVPLTARGLSIGRAYDNDLILDDPYVSPHHVKFFWDGENITVEDLDSKNGLFVEKEKRHDKKVHISSGNRIRIGHTILRFCGLDHQVADTLVERPFLAPLRIFNHSLPMILTYIVTAAYLAFSYYMGTTERVEGYKIAYTLIGIFAAIALWSAFWSFTGKIAIHRWNFMAHCGVASTGILAFSLFHTLTSYLSFAFGLDGALLSIRCAGYLVLTALLLFAHLRFVSQALHYKQIIASGGIAIVLVVLFLTANHYTINNFSHTPRYHVTLKLPIFKLVGSEDTLSFFDMDEGFKRMVDTDALPATKESK